MTAPFDVNTYVQELLAERERTMGLFTADHRPVKMYAIYRRDLEMTPEKLASQCGHAYDLAAEAARDIRPELTGVAYRGTGMGTKVVMYAKNEYQLTKALNLLHGTNIPHALIIDRGDVCLPHFTGKPIVTAIGIGPVYEDEVAHITKHYTLSKAIASNRHKA